VKGGEGETEDGGRSLDGREPSRVSSSGSGSRTSGGGSRVDDVSGGVCVMGGQEESREGGGREGKSNI
jgi:hypothetical protein